MRLWLLVGYCHCLRMSKILIRQSLRKCQSSLPRLPAVLEAPVARSSESVASLRIGGLFLWPYGCHSDYTREFPIHPGSLQAHHRF